MGGSLKRVHCKGNLVSARKQVAHKSPGTKSGLSGLKRVPRPLFKQHCPGIHRQHSSGCLYQQRRGDEVGLPVCPTVENSVLVHQETGNPQGTSHPWLAECDSRQAIQTWPDHSNGMVPSSRSVQSYLTRLWHSFHRDRPKGRRGIPSWNLSLVLHQLTKATFEPLKEASLKHLTFKTVFCWPWVLVNAGVRSMLVFIRTSDTSQTGLRCPCTPHPAFCPRISWLRRVQIVWLQWSSQPCPPLWISHSKVTGLCVQSEPFGITWTGPQILGRTRSWSLSPSRKVLVKTSHLPLSPHGSNKL